MKYVWLLLFTLLILEATIPTGAIPSITKDAAGTARYAASRTRVITVQYSASVPEGEEATGVTQVTYQIFNFIDECKSGAVDSRAVTHGRFWAGGSYSTDLVDATRYYVNLAVWNDDETVYDLQGANPYLCFIFKVEFESTGGFKASSGTLIKVYKNPIADGGHSGSGGGGGIGGFSSVPFPFIPTLLAFSMIVFIRRKR